MKALLLGLFLSAPALAGDFLSLSVDKTFYAPGESALVRVHLATQPEAPFELDVAATLNAQPLPLVRLTDLEFSGVVRELLAGSYALEARLYLQNGRLAKALKEAIAEYMETIAGLQAELAETTDPARIGQLEAQIARFQALKAAAEAELEANRTLVQTKTLTLEVNQ